MIVGPIVAMTIRIKVIIVATTATTIDATTTVAMTVMIGVTTARVIAVTTSVTTPEMIGVMTDVTKTTTTTTTTTAKSGLHRHHLTRATPMVRSSQPTMRSTSSLAVADRPKATNRSDQPAGTLGPTRWFTSLTLGPTRWSLTP
jgi:hypothetical protein